MSQTDEKTIAVLSYITPIGWIIAYVMHQNNVVKSEFSAFHLRQALGIFISGVGLMIVGMIFSILPLIGHLTLLLVRLIILAMWIFGLYYAIDGKKMPVPFVGSLFQVWFVGIG